MDEAPEIVIVCTDLIFSTKITGTAKALQKRFAVARTAERLEMLLAGSAGPISVIVDLSVTALDPINAIRIAKARPDTRVTAFLSHVETEMAAAARDAGADQVLARSAFSARLPDLLAG